MNEIEQDLRSVNDIPVPPATTALDDVLRRGRRRVLAQRAGVAAGVVAVVVGSGFAALALRSAPTSMPPADGPAVTTVTPLRAPWPPADLPAHTPYDTWQPAETAPPGEDRKVLPIPLCSMEAEKAVAQLSVEPVPDDVAVAFGAAVAEAARPATVGQQRSLTLKATRPDSVDSYHRWIDVTDAAGTGSVAIQQGRSTGTPLANADAEAFVSRNCAPPNRLVQPDGTVLQYTSVTPWEPFQTLMQDLRIYRPDGIVLSITLRNFGSPDYDVNAEGTSFNRTGRGRETLPLTVEQLKAIGLALAEVG